MYKRTDTPEFQFITSSLADDLNIEEKWPRLFTHTEDEM